MITLAVEKNDWVYVYDGNKTLYSIPLMGGTLHGFTATSVSIKNDKTRYIYTYDEKGRKISSTPM